MTIQDIETQDANAILSRRGFLRAALVTTAVVGLGNRAPAEQEKSAPAAERGEIVDTHLYVGRWPFARLDGDEPAELVTLLRRSLVSQAWVSSFDGLLHKDVGGVNVRLAETCRREGAGVLIPFGTVNPMLPDWEEELRRCHEVHRMPGIRLHPKYHGYTLADQCFAQLLAQAAARQLIVQLAAWMEDERHVFLSLREPQVDLGPLFEKADRLPGLQLVVSNGFATLKDVDVDMGRGAKCRNVYWDFGRIESNASLSEMLAVVPAEQVVLGSCAPLRKIANAVSKLSSAALTKEQTLAISSRTAYKLMASTRLNDT